MGRLLDIIFGQKTARWNEDLRQHRLGQMLIMRQHAEIIDFIHEQGWDRDEGLDRISHAASTVQRALGWSAYRDAKKVCQDVARLMSVPPKQSHTKPAEQPPPENPSRLRQALERAPKATPAEIARYATEFTVDNVEKTYCAMRRDDFCKVVLTALRVGNLSDDESALAVYIREWVLTNADERLSFPEWFAAGEGLARKALLDREWLEASSRDAAINRMSFNEWYSARR